MSALGKTFIEKPDFYETNRVYLVIKETKEFFVTKVVNLNSWKFNISKIRKSEFRRRLEISPIQMRIDQ